MWSSAVRFNVCMHELQCRYYIGGLGACNLGKVWISGLLKPSLMRYLSNMAETCCKLAIVLANYIVDSYCSLGRLRSDALELLVAITISAETHSLHAAASYNLNECHTVT